MINDAKILLADDEENFLATMAEFLTDNGFKCDCVSDADAAIKKLEAQRYDLLIADIKMPGNSELQLINRLDQIAKGMPVMLITGYPSQDSAIKAIQLSVFAYLVKPFDFDELLSHVKRAVLGSTLYKAVVDTRKRLDSWQKDIDDIETLMQSNTVTYPESVRNFVLLSVRNIQSSLADIENIALATSNQEFDARVCNLLDCPKLTELTNAIHAAIKVLDKTKGSFKSKSLGLLRKDLESLVSRMNSVEIKNPPTQDY